MIRRLALVALVLVLAGCGMRTVRPPVTGGDSVEGERQLSQRESALFERARFDLSGRIAISDGKRGGSGRFEWEQRGQSFTLRFLAPVTAQNWRLEAQPGQALLIESNGAVRVADSAEALLWRELGWKLPADALRYWVLGMRAPGVSSETDFNPDGRLALLRQGDWEISYVTFDETQDPPLPQKLYARSGDYQVRIAVRQWTFK